MAEQILDGSGDGYRAKVDSKKRLHTYSVTESVSAYASETGDSYNFNTGSITLTSASKSALFYIKNNGTNSLVVENLFYIIGNSTGGSGNALITVRRNPTAGTLVSGATDMEMAGVNRNFGSNKTLTVDAYKGAEGSTITDGTKVIETIINQTAQRIAISAGDIIIPKGSSISIEITPATGNTSLAVEFAASVFEYES